MHVIISDVDLQTADDGDTTHYGGSFRIRINPDEMHHLDHVSNFTGNDRSNTPVACIFDIIDLQSDAIDYDCEDYSRLFDAVDEFLNQGEGELHIKLENGVAISIDPIKT